MFPVVAGAGQVTGGVMGMLAPLRPVLLLPEVVDPSKYRNGKLWFADPEAQYILRITNFANTVGTVNSDHVSASSLNNLNELLKPEYKGKIAAHDPSVAGQGESTASFLYVTQGADFVKQLYIGQEVFLTREHRQLGDLLARGSHPIALAIQEQEVGRLEREGFKVAPLTELPGYVTGGFGFLGLLDKAPHPNAAKVFVNWLASQEGAQLFQDAQRQTSTRDDVDVSGLPKFLIPRKGEDPLDSADWRFTLESRAKIQVELQQILGRR
jgi:iron(III) transport system substrate-binding protein